MIKGIKNEVTILQANEYMEQVEEVLDRLTKNLHTTRTQGNLLQEGRLCGLLGRWYLELVDFCDTSLYQRKSKKTAVVSPLIKAEACFQAQREITLSLINNGSRKDDIKKDANNGLSLNDVEFNEALLEVRQGHPWSAHRKLKGLEQAKIKIKMIERESNLLIRQWLLEEALLSLADDKSIESTCLKAKVLYLMGPEHWDACRTVLSNERFNDLDALKWNELCAVFEAKALLPKMTCANAIRLPWEQRREIAQRAWNEYIPWADRWLITSKQALSYIEMLLEAGKTTHGYSLNQLPLATEQVYAAYAMLRDAQAGIGDADLALRTAWVALEHAQSRQGCLANLIDAKEGLAKIERLAEAQRLLTSRSDDKDFLSVPVDEYVSAMQVLGWHEEVVRVLCKKTNRSKSQNAALTASCEAIGRDPELYLAETDIEKKPLSQLDLLSQKYQKTRNESVKSEAIGLWTAMQMANETKPSNDNLNGLSYFADRKPSKTLQSFLSKDMQLKAKKAAPQSLASFILSRPHRRKPPKKIATDSINRKKKADYKKEDVADFVVFSNDAHDDGSPVYHNDTNYTDEFVQVQPIFSDGSSSGSEPVDDDMHGFPQYETNDYNPRPMIDLASSPPPHRLTAKNNPLGKTVNVLKTFAPKHIRISAVIERGCDSIELLVPINEEDDFAITRRTVKWLKGEIGERCAQVLYVKPVIASISYQNGLLVDGDVVTEVLDDGDRVVCKVAVWGDPDPLPILYAKAGGSNLAISARLTQLCKRADSKVLDFSGLNLSDKVEVQLLLLCASIHQQNSPVKHLSFADNFLGDWIWTLLMSIGTKIPSLKLLDLSGNCIKSVPSDIFVHLPPGIVIDVSFNPIHKLPSILYDEQVLGDAKLTVDPAVIK